MDLSKYNLYTNRETIGLPSGISTLNQPSGGKLFAPYPNTPTLSIPDQYKVAPTVTSTVPKQTVGSTIPSTTASISNTNQFGTGKTYTSPTGYTYNMDSSGNPYGNPISNTTNTAVPGSASTLVSPGAYSTSTNPDQASIDAANSYLNSYKDINIDPNSIYQDQLKKYQAAIDATNAMFADRINQARIEGQGRLGSTTALNARSGLLGSDIGQANTNRQQEANTNVINSIQNEQNYEIQKILGQVRGGAEDILKANTEAKRAGAAKTLEFLNVTKPALKAKQVSTATKALVSKGIKDISQFSPEDLNSYLTGLGITKDEFAASLAAEVTNSATAKAEAEKTILANEKTKADIAKLQGEDKQKALDRALEQKKIDVSWYNAQTSRKTADNKYATQNTYDSKTIPQTVKADLLTTIQNHPKTTFAELSAAFPEVDTKYISDILAGIGQ